MQSLFTRSVIAGIVSVVISLTVTYLAGLVIDTTDLEWALIAVAIATFLSGFASYYAGFREEQGEVIAT